MPSARPEQVASPANIAPFSSSNINSHLERIEADYIAQVTTLRLELRDEAKLTEERLREDRNVWRQAAEQFQQGYDQENGGRDENEDEEEVSPSESPTNLGPGAPGGGDGSDDPPSKGRKRLGGDPDPTPPDDPDDDGGREVTSVKISRREADKVAVPPFPRMTHLDSWMAHCTANVLSACADPSHEEQGTSSSRVLT